MIKIKNDIDIDLIVKTFKKNYQKLVKAYGTKVKSNRKRT